MNKTNRKSNIELLRIIAMFLIISFHYVYKSGYVFDKLNYNALVVKIFYFFGELGVNLFLLITGYFMINGKFKIKKLIIIILEVNFYYLFSLLIANKLGVYLITTKKSMILSLFPIIFNKYWFITAYVLLYIFSPYINKLIKNLTKLEYQKLLLLSLLIYSIIPTVFGIFYNNTETLLYYSRFIWAIIVYMIGGYIYSYGIKIYDTKLRTLCIAIISFLIMILGIIVIYRYENIFKKIGTTEVSYFWPPNTIPMVILSVSVFELFLKMDIGYNNVINKLASTTLGVYILHDGILNHYMWQNIFKTKMNLNSKFSLFYILGTAVLIFCLGAGIDLIRQLIEKNVMKRVENLKIWSQIKQVFSNIMNRIYELL